MQAVGLGFSQTIPTPQSVNVGRQITVALLALACVAAAPVALKTKIIVVLTMAAVYAIYNLCIRCLKGKEPVRAEVHLAIPAQLKRENEFGIKEKLDAICLKGSAMGLLLNALREHPSSKLKRLVDCFADVDVINKELEEEDMLPPLVYGVDTKDQFFAVISAMVSASRRCLMLFRYSPEQRKYEMCFMSNERSEDFTNPETAHEAVIKMIPKPKTS